MKDLYKTPIIKIEQLKEEDILCASQLNDNAVLSGKQQQSTQGAPISIFNLDLIDYL